MFEFCIFIDLTSTCTMQGPSFSLRLYSGGGDGGKGVGGGQEEKPQGQL